jgi:hypothetical protein
MLRLWHNHQYYSRFREKSLRRPGAVIRNRSKGGSYTRQGSGRPQGSPLRYTMLSSSHGPCSTMGRATARVAPTIHGAAGPVVYRRGWACPSPVPYCLIVFIYLAIPLLKDLLTQVVVKIDDLNNSHFNFKSWHF